LEHACLRYGVRPATKQWDYQYYDDPSRWRYAARILKQHPAIVSSNIHAAAVSGDTAELERILQAHPEAATERATLDARQPLEYVCYGRLPIPAATDNAVAIARALLDAGAPCQHALPEDKDAHFQPLTGVIGGGENGQPPHPQAQALATLLIEHGADPYDSQALYNNSLGGDELFWLDFLYDRSAQRGETEKWARTASRWPSCPMVDFLLIMAVHRNHPRRAQWALQRGANPRGRHPYYAPHNLHTVAILRGYALIADLLLQSGGSADPLDWQQSFQAACLRLDRETAARLAKEHPEYLENPAPLMVAAERDLADVAGLLLDLGMSADLAGHGNFRPLHAAASNDSVRVGTLLLERGAEIDPVEDRFNSVPLGWAIHGNRRRMMDILGAVSRNPWALVRMGNTKRLRELFASQPELAKSASERGSLLFALPENEDLAFQVAGLLLASGTDPSITAKGGTTAIQYAEKQGLDAVVDLLSRPQKTR
jgi:ankyrin repeat protein